MRPRIDCTMEGINCSNAFTTLDKSELVMASIDELEWGVHRVSLKLKTIHERLKKLESMKSTLMKAGTGQEKQ